MGPTAVGVGVAAFDKRATEREEQGTARMEKKRGGLRRVPRRNNMVVEPGQRGLYRHRFSGAGQAGTQIEAWFVRFHTAVLHCTSHLSDHTGSPLFSLKKNTSFPERHPNPPPSHHLLLFINQSQTHHRSLHRRRQQQHQQQQHQVGQLLPAEPTAISTTDTSFLQLAQ